MLAQVGADKPRERVAGYRQRGREILFQTIE